MKIEADICICDSDPSRIIMAHPPKREGDLTLLEWVQLVLDHCARNPAQKVGIKLDFKDPPTVAPSITFLSDLFQKGKLNIPLWINADIMAFSGRKTPFNPDSFVSVVQEKLPGVVLSVGWVTTPWQNYTKNDVDAILAICAKYRLRNTSFPLRGSLCKSSVEALRLLLNADPSYTLTVWSGPEKMSLDDYHWLKSEFDGKRIFLDVPFLELRKAPPYPFHYFWQVVFYLSFLLFHYGK